MADKAFKTYTEQRKILENRGLIISHPRSFRDIMLREGYYNIINGYKKHFLTTTSPDQYIAQTTFEQLYALYLFDQELRTLFMSALIKIEKHIKALLAYHFSEKYGNDDNVYMNLNNFNCDTIQYETREEPRHLSEYSTRICAIMSSTAITRYAITVMCMVTSLYGWQTVSSRSEQFSTSMLL